MLPELPKETERYLIWLYRRKVHPDDVKRIYNDSAKVIREYVDPSWTAAGNHLEEFTAAAAAAAVLYVHQVLSSNQSNSFAARYCMHALLAPYSKAIAAKNLG